MSNRSGDTSYDVDILRRIEDTTLNDQDLARDAKILNDWKPSDSEIRTFLKDKCVLVTGGTGFLGKVLIEKLLRTCTELKAVFMLVREKKGKDVNEIVDDLFKQSVFDVLRKEQPNFRRKVVSIKGDAQSLNLGLTEADRSMIQSEVSVIFHAAASVRFDLPLRHVVRVNVRGTGEMLKLARGCVKLSSFVYFSTAYSYCIYDRIDEVFYDPPITPHDLIELVENTDEEKLEIMKLKLIGKFPNTYAYSKAVAEYLVQTYGRGLPICVFRPSVVIGTYREPLRGWADNMYGTTGILVGAGTGLIRTLYCDPEKTADLVPVDMVVNAAIVSAWKTALEGPKSDDPTIYNYVSSCQKPITWKEFCKLNKDSGIKVPTVYAVWYYSFTLNKIWYIHMLMTIFLHYLPAIIVDGINFVMRKEVRMLKAYKKIYNMNINIAYFTMRDWKFTNTNVQNLWLKLNGADQYMFNFNIDDLNWERHAETYLMGLRVYFLKDPATTLPEARKKWQRLKYLHNASKVLLVVLGLFMIWTVLLKNFF